MSYGCHNRRPFVGTVKTSHGQKHPFTMSPLCEYSLTDLGKADAGCAGCKWIEITRVEKAKKAGGA